jgi:hypothetical protein
MARPLDWSMLGFIAKAFGFLLVFVGTLVLVLGTNPTTSALNLNILYGSILTGRLLWTIGLAAIGAGAGIKIRYVYVTPPGEMSDARARLLRASMWRNTVEFIIVLFLLVFLLTVGT